VPTFVYSPEVRIHVAADGTNIPEYAGLQFDISDDLVAGSVILRTNGVHTANFQLQNAQRKYDGVLQPMDRITIEMKRITWVRVFSGYLNNGPIFSAWPRVLNMSASCTLKRLQFWYWDPTTTAAYNLVTGALAAQTEGGQPGDTVSGGGESPIGPDAGPNTEPLRAVGLRGGDRERITVARPRGGMRVGAPGDPGEPAPPPGTGTPATPPVNPAEAEGAPQKFDDTVKGTVIKILTEVVGWPEDKVHIGALPDEWVKLASEVGNLILKDTDVSDLIGDLSRGNQAGLATDAAMGATSDEAPGIVKIISDVARGRFGAEARKAAITGTATGLVESNLRNLSGGDRDSVGVFQQRPSMGWGTVEQCMNVTYAAGKFFSRFPANWASMNQGDLAQSVQRSAFPDKYGQRMGQAATLVDQFGGPW
jgi:hypothetical protein